MDAAARNVEIATVAHVATFVVIASWAFGGNIYWIREPLAWWGTLGAILLAVGVYLRARSGQRLAPGLLGLLPLVALSAFVIASTFNPNGRELELFGATVLRSIDPTYGWLPSTAIPERSRQELWLYAGLYLSAYGLLTNVHRARSLRCLGYLLVANAAFLAVFGIVQKLSGADGLFFGRQPSPNPAFFASFIYHNHWGPFAVLMTALAFALVAERWRQGTSTPDARLTLGLLGVAVLVLAASVPLSTSRSSSLLMLVLLFAGSAANVRRLSREAGRRSAILFGFASLAALAGVLWLSAPIVQARLAKTREQLAERSATGGLGGREILYGNTWRMFCDRPWAGWGLESFEPVFVRYNTDTSPQDHLAPRYDQAHSDWLQTLAELGVIGTTLVLGLAVVPARLQRTKGPGSPAGHWLFIGCGLLVLYSAVEFPLANPAVTLSFWVAYFAAWRWARLTR